jgi:diaminopimelate decarboxylase
MLHNYHQIRDAFAPLNAHLHYSAKANGSLSILRTLIEAGAGIDTVSGGEIFRALRAGAQPSQIVFAGVGKTREELRYAVEQGVGWINIENVGEAALLNDIAGLLGKTVRVALRFNPDVMAHTHKHIATGHGGSKFGLTAAAVQALLAEQGQFPCLKFEGIHVHIGSQLHDTDATVEAVQAALALVAPYEAIRTIDIGGGLPARYMPGEALPQPEAFAEALAPLVRGYAVILEPGRSIIADAGALLTQVLYRKAQGGRHFVIVDAGMTDLIRPMLYEAQHDIVPLKRADSASDSVDVVGPVCESTDVLATDRRLGEVQPGDGLAVLGAGAYGMVMASNYNARRRPAEVMVMEDGHTWRVIRQRETWDDLIRGETGAD